MTTILASDFRDRLDHLIRSLVHRQIRSPRVGPQQHEGGVPRAPLTPLTIPSPPPPPPQPARSNSFWPRPAQQRSRLPVSAHCFCVVLFTISTIQTTLSEQVWQVDVF